MAILCSDAWEAVQGELQGSVLGFYSSVDPKLFKCHIELGEAEVQESALQGSFTGTQLEEEKPGIVISGKGGTYKLAARNENDRRAWMERLQAAAKSQAQQNGATEIIAQLRAKYAEPNSKVSGSHKSSGARPFHHFLPCNLLSCVVPLYMHG